MDGPQARGYKEIKSMTVYFVAGEVSADNHGAALMRSLRGSILCAFGKAGERSAPAASGVVGRETVGVS